MCEAQEPQNGPMVGGPEMTAIGDKAIREVEAEYMECIAFMLKKAYERCAEQQRDPNPLLTPV